MSADGFEIKPMWVNVGETMDAFGNKEHTKKQWRHFIGIRLRRKDEKIIKINEKSPEIDEKNEKSPNGGLFGLTHVTPVTGVTPTSYSLPPLVNRVETGVTAVTPVTQNINKEYTSIYNKTPVEIVENSNSDMYNQEIHIKSSILKDIKEHPKIEFETLKHKHKLHEKEMEKIISSLKRDGEIIEPIGGMFISM
jgi:hypothetical protein